MKTIGWILLALGMIALAIFTMPVSTPEPPPHTHGWSMWTNHPGGNINLHGRMFQQRYCTNCGWHQGENH